MRLHNAPFAVLVAAALTAALAVAPCRAQAPDPKDLGTEADVQLVVESGGHTAPLTQMVFTADSRELITCSLDKTIRFWDLGSGRCSRVVWPPSGTGYLGKVGSIALSPDGKTLAFTYTVFADRGRRRLAGRIGLLRLADGLVERMLEGTLAGDYTQFPISPLAFSPDGKFVVAGDDTRCLRFWDTATGKEDEDRKLGPVPERPPGHAVGALAFSPDGKLLACGSGYQGGRVRVWSVADKKPVYELESPRQTPAGAAWSPDGQVLATGVSPGLTVLKRDGTAFKELWKEPGRGGRQMAFTPKGRQILHLGPGPWTGVRWASLRDARTGVEKRRFAAPNLDGLSLTALSPDGELVAVAGERDPKDIYVYKADGTLLRQLAGQGERVAAAAWTVGGKGIAWASRLPAKKGEAPTYTRAFSLDRLALEKEVPEELHAQQHTYKDLKLQMQAGRVHIFKDGKDVGLVDPPRFTYTSPLQFTFVGEGLVAGTNGGYLGLSDAVAVKGLRTLSGHNANITSVAALPSGRYVLSAGVDQTMNIWSPQLHRKVPSRQPLRPLLSVFVAGNDWVVWTQEGYYASSSGGERLVGWAVSNGPDQVMTFHPAQRFRKFFYRPDLIRLVLEKGDVEEALEAVKVKVAVHKVEEVLPPRLKLHITRDGETLRVEATAEADSKGQPVTALHLLLDGRPALQGGKEAVKKFDPPRQKGALAEWSLTLPPGAHTVSVRAHSRDTYALSPEVTYRGRGLPKANKRGTLYYVGVGINKFKNDKNLNLDGAVPDILRLEACLKTSCKDRFADIQTIKLLDEKATREGVQKKLEELQKKVKPADVVIVHLCTHGDVQGEKGLFLLTHDSKPDQLAKTALSGSDLRDTLARYPSQVLLLLDACHAGGYKVRPPIDPLTRLLADDSCGVTVMTAALANQKAEETPTGGVFTSAVVQGLQGGARADEYSHRVFVHNLYVYVYSAVTRATANRQMPHYLPSGTTPPIVLKEEAAPPAP